MQIRVEIPDELASRLVPAGQDPSRGALEAIGIEAYRQHRITSTNCGSCLVSNPVTSWMGFSNSIKSGWNIPQRISSASANWASGFGKSDKLSLPRKRNVSAALDDCRL